MQAEAISTIITSVFLLFIVLGLLFGWWRGYAKSLFRLGLVIGVAVLTFFVVPHISKALLTLDISSLNIVIGETAATNVQELIIALLESIPYVQDLVSSSAAFEAVIVLIPEILLNLVGFALFFYLFRFASLIIYWIMNAILMPKKKQEGKNKHRMIGALIGAVQGAVIAIVLLLPVYGTLSMVSPIINDQTIASVNTQIVSDFAYAEEGSDGDDADKDEAIFESVITTSKDYLNAIENSFLTKMFKTVGITQLADITFEKLTTVQHDDTEFNLKKEVKIVSDAYKHIDFITKEEIDFTNPEHVAKLDKAIEVLLTSNNLSDIVNDIVIEVAECWTNPEPEDQVFMGIKKPSLPDELLDEAFNKVLVELKSTANVKEDISAIMDAYIVISNADLLKSTDVVETLKAEGNELLLTNVLKAVTKSSTLKACMPEVLNCGVKYLFNTIGFGNISGLNTEVEINDEEIANIQAVFDEIILIYDKLEAEEIKSTDLTGVLTKIDGSSLFNGSDIETTIVTLKDTLNIAEKMQDFSNPDSTITKDDVSGILDTLTKQEDIKEAVYEMINNNTVLEDMGMDPKTVDVVKDVINNVITSDDFVVDNEADAVVEILNTATKIMASDTAVTLEADEQKALVDALVKSDSITNLLAENVKSEEGKNQTLDIASQLEAETLNDIKDLVAALPEGTEEEIAKKQLLEEIFKSMQA